MISLGTAWAAVSRQGGKAFQFIARSAPAQIALAALTAYFMHRRAMAKAEKIAARTAEAKTLGKIERKTQDVVKKIEEAEARTLEENRVTADLNAGSLRKLTERDPDNAGRPDRN